jgi:tetratricopeptide (TPR) repeat protein
MMGQASATAPVPFLMSKSLSAVLISVFLFGLVTEISAAQVSKRKASSASHSSIQRGVDLAKSGHCKEAFPLLKAASLRTANKDLKRQAGFAAIRCAMTEFQPDVALEFLRFLNQEFPRDPDVLYLATHTYSDLSTRAAQELAMTAPNSYQAHKLNAESLEVQGKWDAAAKEYKLILEQNPRLPGIHFLLGRLLLSKPDPGPTAAEDAKKEFQQELEIDPSNAGAEYVLGELARQESQWPEAIAHFSRATQLDVGFGDAFLGLGSSLISARRFAEAIPPLETAVKLEPQNPGAHYNLAMAFSRAGRKEDADRECAVHRQMTQKSAPGDGPQQATQPENPN